MDALKTVIWIVNIFSSLAIIGLVLMQHGRGADAGANFGGSGSAQGVFGSAGNANFLTRMTAIAATVFFASCLMLGYINSNASKKGGLDFSNVQQSSVSKPAANVAAASDAALPQAAASVASASGEGIGGSAAAAAIAGAAAAKVVADKSAEKPAAEAEKKDKKAVEKKANAKKNKKSANK